MTDALERFPPTARCIACDARVLELCKDGVARHIECTTSPNGEWAYIAGRWQELPAGGMVAPGVMRFRDHHKSCKASLRPDPSDVPTRDLKARKRRPDA